MIKTALYSMLRRFVFPNKGITHIKRNPQLIVSLTSHPGRINVVEKTITSILKQSIKPDRVILWLESEKFPKKEKELPGSLRVLCKFGLEIKWYPNLIRSYNKLIPTLKLCPDSIIVTADDDIIYQENWLERLYSSYLMFPNEIHCHHAYNYIVNKNCEITGFYPCQQEGCVSGTIVAMGVGGVLYPPHSLCEDVLMEELFQCIAPTNDDFWFWAMAKINHTPTRLIHNHETNLVCIDNTQDDGLWMSTNVNGDGSTQFQQIIKHYPQLKQYLA